MRAFILAIALFHSLPAAAGKPFYMVRPQPLLGHGEPERVGEVGRFLADALGDVGGYDVVLLDPDRSERPVEEQPVPAKLEKRWRAELDFAETNLRMKKPGTSIKGAKVVWRRLKKSPELIGSPEILCRTYLIFAESYLQLGKEKKAEPWIKRLATSCEDTYREGRWRAKPSAKFTEKLAQVRQLMTMVAPAQLTIITEQAGAQVFIDARLAGETPLRLTGLPPGPHVLKVRESDRRSTVRWVELTPKPQVLRLEPQADWVAPAEAGLFASIAENRIDDRAVAGVRAMLERVGGPPYLAIPGILEGKEGVRILLVLVDKRGRILRVPEVVVDDSFLGLEVELEAMFAKIRGGTLRWTALNSGPIFKELERKTEIIPQVPFKAMAAAKGSVEGDDERKEDKDVDPEEDEEQEDKDRMRPVLRKSADEKKAEPKMKPIRRARRYKDYKDSDDK